MKQNSAEIEVEGDMENKVPLTNHTCQQEREISEIKDWTASNTASIEFLQRKITYDAAQSKDAWAIPIACAATPILTHRSKQI